MANNEGENANVGGNEWEVVSLTASAYAAAPGPVKVKDGDEGALSLDASSKDGAETSKAMFMSRHFMDPLEHENPEFVPSDSSILEKDGGKHNFPEFLSAEGKSQDETGWAFKVLAVPDEFSGMDLSGEKSGQLSIHGTEFEEESNLQSLNLVNKDSSLYSAASVASSFSSLQSETARVLPTNYVENVTTFEEDCSEHGSDLCADQSPKSKKIKGDKVYEPDSDSDLPWWKRRAASLYAQVKAANAFWTVFVAGAVVGIVILQQRWQQEKQQVLRLRWHVTHSLMSDSVGGAE